MIVLAIETTGTTCGVALARNGALIAETSLFMPSMHDAQLASLVMSTLSSCDVSLDDVNACALSIGPGSFTGLRIGLSFVKGLCFDDRMRFVAVPTLEACAAAADEVARVAGRTEIVSIVSSHRDLCYVQVFDVTDTGVAAKTDISIVTNDEARAMVSQTALPCGPGSASLLPSAVSGLTRLSPRFVLRAAMRRIAEERFDNIHTAIPLYAQDFIPRTP